MKRPVTSPLTNALALLVSAACTSGGRPSAPQANVVTITAAGHSSEATVRLAPGTHLMECHAKTSGFFRSHPPDPGTSGMVHHLGDTAAPSGAPEPRTAVRPSISSDRGIEVDGEPVAAPKTVAFELGGYAWVSEAPKPDESGMIATFSGPAREN